MIGFQSVRGELRHHEILHAALGDRQTGRQPLAHMVERRVLDRVERDAGAAMAGELIFCPDRFGHLDEIGRCDHFDAQAAHQFDRPRVHPADVGDRATGGDLHRNASRARQERGQPVTPRLPRDIGGDVGRQVAQPARLDGVRQPTRLTLRRDEARPAPAHEAVGRDAGDAQRDGVQAFEIIQQPAVEPLGADGGLDGGESVHGR